MIEKHPWFGVGPEEVRLQFNDYVPPDVPRPLPTGWYGHLHNIYLQYAAERGIPTMLMLMWALIQALADFSRALELAPTPDNYYQRAATYELLGEYRSALADLDLMVATSPGSPQAYSARAEARLVLGDVEGVKRDRRRAQELFPPPDRVLNNLRTSVGVSH